MRLSTTLSDVRKALAAAMSYPEDDVNLVARRAREIGLVPAGKAGENGSAPLQLHHGLILAMGLMSVERPGRKILDAIEWGSLKPLPGIVLSDVQMPDRTLGRAEQIHDPADQFRNLSLFGYLLTRLLQYRADLPVPLIETLTFANDPLLGPGVSVSELEVAVDAPQRVGVFLSFAGPRPEGYDDSKTLRDRGRAIHWRRGSRQARPAIRPDLRGRCGGVPGRRCSGRVHRRG
jgi:hypothetical protein